MPLLIVVDGTVYTQSGDKKTYESGIFSYDTNIPNAKAPSTAVSDDGTYMNYGLPIFFNFAKSDSSSSYYYTTYYGTGIRKATKTFYYNYREDIDPTPSKKYYLHISADCVAVNSLGSTDSKNTGIVVSLILNNNESDNDAVALIALYKLNSSLSLSCIASGLETKYSSAEIIVQHTNVSLPANTVFIDVNNEKYLYAIGIRPDIDYTYPNYTKFYTSKIRWYSYNPTSVSITLDDGTSVTATIVYH